MKKLIILLIALSLCGAGAGAQTGGGPAKSAAASREAAAGEQFRVLTEKYFISYMKAQLDPMLATLHPQGPMYPQEWAIKRLRETAQGNAVPGEAKASAVKVLDLGETTARAQMTMKMRADVMHNGNYSEQTALLTVEYHKLGNEWRIWKIEKK